MLLHQLAVLFHLAGGDDERQRLPARSLDRQGGEFRRHPGAEAAARVEEDQQELPTAEVRQRLVPASEVRQPEGRGGRAERQALRRRGFRGRLTGRRCSLETREALLHRFELQEDAAVLPDELVADPTTQAHEQPGKHDAKDE